MQNLHGKEDSILVGQLKENNETTMLEFTMQQNSVWENPQCNEQANLSQFSPLKPVYGHLIPDLGLSHCW